MKPLDRILWDRSAKAEAWRNLAGLALCLAALAVVVWGAFK